MKKHIRMEAFAWVKVIEAKCFSCFKLAIEKRNASHFLTCGPIYCISLLKTVSPNWDYICNIWFLSSCAKYTKLKKERKKKVTTSIRRLISYTDTPLITPRTTINTKLEALLGEEEDAIDENVSVDKPHILPLHAPLTLSDTFLNTDTHTCCSALTCVCWNDVGGKLSFGCAEQSRDQGSKGMVPPE